ncbi:MAG: DUF6384 family protein [Planctomycetota bacterium]
MSDPDPVEPQSLPELLRIMDVATALRRERETAAAQLDLDQTQGRLRERLRATADATGEPVTDAEIQAAIDQYFRTLHRFEEPPRSWRTVLAHLYVRRGAVIGATAALLAVGMLGWWLFGSSAGPWSSAGREARQAARQQSELDRAWARLGDHYAAVIALAKDTNARAEAERLKANADELHRLGARDRLDEITAQLQALHARLDIAFEIQIVQRPDERSGIPRYYEDENGKRVSGYYVIVEAVDATGRRLRRLVHNAEDGEKRRVQTWGEQVPKAVWDRIAADKRSDGVLDEKLFAMKRRGALDEEIVLTGTDGKPLVRGRQITEW